MEIISLLLPTRQRPRQLARLVNSVDCTARRPDLIEIVTYIDDDDPSYDDLALPVEWVKVRGPRHHDGLVNLSVKWNECYAACSGDIIMHCGDDIVFRTDHWDDVVRGAFPPDRIAFVFGDDGYQTGNNFGTHGFIHRKWIDAVGYLFPPLFVSDFNDTFLNDVSKRIGRHFEVPIFTEHMHYICGKAEIDQNTRERLERHNAHRPQDIYYGEEGQAMLRDAISRLRRYIDSHSQKSKKST